MDIGVERLRKLSETVKALDKERAPWWQVWKEISDYFLPRRYPWLLTDKEVKSASVRNTTLLDSTSIIAVRTLATGMMNGITSPTRPWFNLRLSGFREEEEEPYNFRLWLDTAAERMLILMNESNFYNALGTLYLEWVTMGTAAMTISEDVKSVFRCYNHPVGGFYLSTDSTNRINRFARQFTMTVEQLAAEFGVENLSPQLQADHKAGGARLYNSVKIAHIIESNERDPIINKSSPYREIYWELGAQSGKVLRVSTLEEFNTIAPRWDVYATDTYGTSPCMDALPDVKQLQQMVKRRGQGLDTLVRPPMLINKMLASSPKALNPGGNTYVAGTDLQQGARPVFQLNFPFAEVNGDILDIRQRIQIGLFNDLFKMISQLETVRSATEIDARREEKLILLGPVLQRFCDEGLDPAIDRIFQICLRAGVFPPLPEGMDQYDISVEYTGILADAQRAVGTVAIERYLQVVGNMAAVFPEALEVANGGEIIREYGNALGLKTKLQRSREEVAQAAQARQQQQSALESAQTAQTIVDGAQQLSATDLGGGQNALQAILGG